MRRCLGRTFNSLTSSQSLCVVEKQKIGIRVHFDAVRVCVYFSVGVGWMLDHDQSLRLVDMVLVTWLDPIECA